MEPDFGVVREAYPHYDADLLSLYGEDDDTQEWEDDSWRLDY